MTGGVLLAAATALLFFLMGRYLPGRRRTAKPPTPPKPLCGCGHHLSFHEASSDEGGSCHARVKGKATRWNTYGDPKGWELVQCSCQRYTGPRMLDPGYVAREIS